MGVGHQESIGDVSRAYIGLFRVEWGPAGGFKLQYGIRVVSPTFASSGICFRMYLEYSPVPQGSSALDGSACTPKACLEQLNAGV